MDVPGHSGYFGHVVMGATINLVPYLADVDTSTIEGRLLLSTAGAMGALIAIIGDRPKTVTDAIARVVVGVFSCFLFAPWLAKKIGLDSDLNGNLLVFGLLGILSWYITGSVTRGLIAARDSGSLWRAILAAIRQNLPSASPPEVVKEPKSPRKKTVREPDESDIRPPTPKPEPEPESP